MLCVFWEDQMSLLDCATPGVKYIAVIGANIHHVIVS
jgi:hypothetical protein